MVPKFPNASNYYLAIWDQDADGNLSINNFKARYGCGDGTLCTLAEQDPVVDITCLDNGTYTVEVLFFGTNGEYEGVDNTGSAISIGSNVCLTNITDTPNVTNGSITFTYPQGTDYDVTIQRAADCEGNVVTNGSAARR